MVDGIITDLKAERPAEPNVWIRYSGEREQKIREENERLGIPVNKDIWNVKSVVIGLTGSRTPFNAGH
jgi:LDH2 family malate/lactate/ureidoglycolate dehydrogenase